MSNYTTTPPAVKAGTTIPELPTSPVYAPMLPTPPECGSPCALCESLAHLLAKTREELGAVRKGSATVCRELRAEIAALRADKPTAAEYEAVCTANGALERELAALRAELRNAIIPVLEQASKDTVIVAGGDDGGIGCQDSEGPSPLAKSATLVLDRVRAALAQGGAK